MSSVCGNRGVNREVRRKDKMIFCTLFDSNYLDKGLALYLSMKKNIDIFKLYIFAFDRKCFEILFDMKLKNVVLLSVEDILNEELRKVQKDRSLAEFCWTCTPFVIRYVLQEYREKICTYIDADTYFFSDPINAIQEILDNECSVGLVEHRFERNFEYGEHIFSEGKYCIQFNTFFNNKEGMEVLEDWKNRCLEWCYYRYEDGKLGDQRYPDKWRQRYACVHESQNLGIGVAPWNLYRYELCQNKKGKIYMKYKDRKFLLVFYHFEGMRYLDNGKIHLNVWKPETKGMNGKIHLIYGEYFRTIIVIRKFLSRVYNITFEHMLIDYSHYLEKRHSLKKFCDEQGIFNGGRQWFGYWKNNMVFISKI